MRPAAEKTRVGLVVPLQGPAGIFGPSCEAVAATALRAINAVGILGRQVDIEVIDGARSRSRSEPRSASWSTRGTSTR